MQTPPELGGNFNPRSPCGERQDWCCYVAAPTRNFNPRSPCGERQAKTRRKRFSKKFQSTLPVWGATQAGDKGNGGGGHFNPRSPCGERHQRQRLHLPGRKYFNPRSPCGERHKLPECLFRVYRFQSTLPVWGATQQKYTTSNTRTFQSTLPVWGATVKKRIFYSNFQFFSV